MPDAPSTPSVSAPVHATPTARAWLRRSREAILWTALIGFLVYMDWPMLRGYYFKLTGSVAPRSTIAWRTDLAGALTEAKQRGLPVLVDAGADWCPPCIAMKHDVWPDDEVAARVAQGFIPLLVDVDASPAVADRYGIATIPTVMVLDADGAVLRKAGYLPKSGMLRFLVAEDW
jgi:thioredoxin 1